METKKTAHTPGPWEIKGVPGTGQMFAIVSPNTIPEGRCIVAQLPRTFGTENLRTQESDARLIAAAPDLLEAAKDLFDLDRIGYSVPGRAGDGYHKAFQKLRAAIAKAEGREVL